MHTRRPPSECENGPGRTPLRSRAKSLLRLGAIAAGLGLSASAQAMDYGPFFLTGFLRAEMIRTSHQCATPSSSCQRFPDENKQRVWADQLINGTPYGADNIGTVLFQPTLGARFDVGGGFKAEAVVSQRFRNGQEDIAGFYYGKNVAISHEDYGSLRVGAMTTRGWSVADYPYGTNLGLADPWGAAGAGYGLVAKAIRYTSRPFDVGGGELVLEATYDQGDTGFKTNKPSFVEVYAQYRNGDLLIDAIYQNSRNGNPQAWSKGPFTGLTPFPEDDDKLGGSGQGMTVVMARYQVDQRIELSGGIRRNWWSGAYAVITQYSDPQQWNNMFNVDWSSSATLPGGSQPGYSVSSVDLLGGLRYRMGRWIAATGMMYLGKGSSSNPSERGQGNSALINTVQLSYEVGHGLSFYGVAGMVRYDRQGLSPMSMPTNSAFTNVDSRITRNGNWAGFGLIYVH